MAAALAAFHMASYAKSGAQAWAAHRVLLSMWGWAGKADGAERGKAALKAALPSNESCF